MKENLLKKIEGGENITYDEAVEYLIGHNVPIEQLALVTTASSASSGGREAEVLCQGEWEGEKFTRRGNSSREGSL